MVEATELDVPSCVVAAVSTGVVFGSGPGTNGWLSTREGGLGLEGGMGEMDAGDPLPLAMGSTRMLDPNHEDLGLPGAELKGEPLADGGAEPRVRGTERDILKLR